MNTIATVRSNRKNMPKALSAIKLKKLRVLSTSNQAFLVAKWKDINLKKTYIHVAQSTTKFDHVYSEEHN